MSFGSAKREALYKQVNPLGAYIARDCSQFSDSCSADGTISKIDSRWRRPATAHFGYSTRADYEAHANYLQVPTAQDHSEFNDTTDADKIISKLDSRFQTAPSATFGVSKRSDILKRANELGTYEPKDYSDVGDSVNVEQLTKAIDQRYRTPATPPIGTARRDDYVFRANPLGVLMPRNAAGDAPLRVPASDFDRAAAAARAGGCGHTMGASNRDASLKLYNPQNVPLPKDLSARDDRTDASKLMSPMNSRWKNQPRVPFSTSKRADILKQANVLGVAQPSSITSTVKYPTKTISDFDSRFKTQPRVPMATAAREDIYKLANPLGAYVAKDYSEMSDSTAADGTISKIDSRWKRPPSVHFGHSKRSDIDYQANFLGSPTALDHSEFQDTTDASKVVSKMDSRYKTAPSPTFGVSKRSDISKRANELGTYEPKDYSDVEDSVNVDLLTKAIDKRYRTPATPPIGTARRDDYVFRANPLGVLMPRNAAGDAPLRVPASDFDRAAAAARRGGCGHTMGASSRGDVLKLYNPQNVPLPKDLSGRDAGLSPGDPTPQVVSPIDSRYRRPRSCTFGVGNREDVVLLANPLGAKHAPHSRRAAELKERQDAFFGRKLPKNGKGCKGGKARAQSAPARRGPGGSRGGGGARGPSGSDISEGEEEGDKRDEWNERERGNRKPRLTAKQLLLEEVRRENARHRKQANEGKLQVLRKARQNSSSWVKHFQRTLRTPV